MQKIENSLSEFKAALDAGKQIVCNGKNEWKEANWLTRLIRWIFGKNESDSVLKTYLKFMAEVEAKDLFFNASPEQTEKQKQFYENVKSGARSVLNYKNLPQGPKTTQLKQILEISLIQLNYQIEGENGGFDKLSKEHINQQLASEVEVAIKDWQSKDKKFEFAVQYNYRSKIEELCQCPELVQFLLKKENENLRDEQFKLILRDNFSSEVALQYGSISETLSNCLLAKRLGALEDPNIIRVVKEVQADGSFQKKLELRFEGVYRNILDKNLVVEFSNGLKWNRSKILADFRNKKDVPGDLELMQDGIIPFNGHFLGPRIKKPKSCFDKLKIVKWIRGNPKDYASVDVTQPNWFEKLPVFDVRSKDYLEKRYNVELKPGEWGISLQANRGRELDIQQAHGYSVIFQPIGNDRYRVYPFGAFPIKFPQKMIELVNFICDTVKGTIAFDPNIFYSQSQNAAFTKSVDEKVAKAIFAEFADYIKNGMIFQLAGENCAYRMESIWKKAIKKTNADIELPNLFVKSFLKVQTSGLLEVIRRALYSASDRVADAIKVTTAIFFRAMRARQIVEDGREVTKSTWNSPFFDNLKLHLPSAMHYRKKRDLEKKALNPNYVEKYAEVVLGYGHGRTLLAQAA